MDTALSSDRAYFDASGRLIFHFSNRSSTATVRVMSEDLLDNAILGSRQSPAAAVLAAMAVLVFGFAATQSSLFAVTRLAAAGAIATTAQGFAALSSDVALSMQHKAAMARNQLWGQSVETTALPFTALSTRVRGPVLSSETLKDRTASVPLGGVDDLLQKTQASSLAAAVLASVHVSTPTLASVPGVLRDTYLALGAEVYGGITASMQAYKDLIDMAGAHAYTLGGIGRDAIVLAPSVALQGLTTLGGGIIATTHLAIATETALVYQFVDLSPRVAQSITLAVGNTGAYLGQRTATELPRALAWAVQEPSIAGPAMSQIVVNSVYGNAVHFVRATGVVRAAYGSAVAQTGNTAYALAVGAGSLRSVAVGAGVHALAMRAQSVYGAVVTQSTHLLSAAFVGARAAVSSGR